VSSHGGRDNTFRPKRIEITVDGRKFELTTVESIKICGITFSNDLDLCYRINVLDKIDKLKRKLLSWQFRGLTLGGKLLVTKTFGISQLIYSMQAVEFRHKDLEKTESFIFSFLWSRNCAISRAPDIIKREVMKRDYKSGGLKVPDLKALNGALKLRQFMRASCSRHPIKLIQKFIMEGLDYDHVLCQEYSRIAKLESVVATAQHTMNILTEITRSEIDIDLTTTQNTSQLKINLIASVDITEYLNIKNQPLIKCLYNRLFRCGVENFKQLVMEESYPRSEVFYNIAKSTLNVFPKNWAELIRENIECDNNIDLRDSILISNNKHVSHRKCTVGQIKTRLLSNNESFTFPFETKLGLVAHEGLNPFVTCRKILFSTNLKIFKFRLLHCDIFSKQRMFKFKMSPNENCDLCNICETIKHVLWECPRAATLWRFLSDIINTIGSELVLSFECLFIGFAPTEPVFEAIITRMCQILLRIDRSSLIPTGVITNEIVTLANLYLFNKKTKDMNKIMWANIKGTCMAQI